MGLDVGERGAVIKLYVAGSFSFPKEFFRDLVSGAHASARLQFPHYKLPLFC